MHRPCNPVRTSRTSYAQTWYRSSHPPFTEHFDLPLKRCLLHQLLKVVVPEPTVAIRKWTGQECFVEVEGLDLHLHHSGDAVVADVLEMFAHALEESEAPPTRIDNRPSLRAYDAFLEECWYDHCLRLRGSLSNAATMDPVFGGIRGRGIG